MLNAQAFASEPYVKQTKKDCIECHVDKYYPGKDFFKAETKTKWHYHWWAFSIFLFVFSAGILGKVYVWSMGHGKVLPGEEIEKKKLANVLFFEAILQRKSIEMVYLFIRILWIYGALFRISGVCLHLFCF
jgi:hypothetical protein